MKNYDVVMRLGDALRVKSAEFWLMLGQPLQALRELQGLPNEVSRHPWTESVRQHANRAAGTAHAD